MKFSVITLFPEMFDSPFEHSIIKRALDKKIISIDLINLRDFGIGKHRIVDDRPYGGGAGMVLRADVVAKAIESIKLKTKKEKIILITPQGKVFSQKEAVKLSKFDHLIFVLGHYEGFDERIRKMIDYEISIGDYILTGGELPAMVILDSVTRLLPKVLGKKESSEVESFKSFKKDNKEVKLLEYPQYTRPEKFGRMKVPGVLLSGNHKKILEWRENEAYNKTKRKRPDLLRT